MKFEDDVPVKDNARAKRLDRDKKKRSKKVDRDELYERKWK